MKRVVSGKTLRVVVWSSKGSSPRAVFPCDDAWSAATVDGVDDIQRRFLTVKSVSGSPLRDDLDLCLSELDALISALQATSPILDYLGFEMENHRLKIIDALQSGYEL